MVAAASSAAVVAAVVVELGSPAAEMEREEEGDLG